MCWNPEQYRIHLTHLANGLLSEDEFASKFFYSLLSERPCDDSTLWNQLEPRHVDAFILKIRSEIQEGDLSKYRVFFRPEFEDLSDSQFEDRAMTSLNFTLQALENRKAKL